MKRFTWWMMEQNAPHNARERWSASCSILHHVKRFMSHSPTVVREPGLGIIDGSFLIGAQIFARAGCIGVYKKCAPIKKDGTIVALSTREQRYVWDFSALGARLAVDVPREEAKQTLEHFPSL